MKLKHKRLTFVALSVALFGAAVGLMLNAFSSAVVFFKSPTEILAETHSPDRRLRVGGLVEAGSVVRNGDTVAFRVTDMANAVTVSYRGLLPDLFREGQGVVAEGFWRGDRFVASEVLAKHDETYMPAEVTDALKKSGRWQETEGKGHPDNRGVTTP